MIAEVKKYVDRGTETTQALQFQPGMKSEDIARFVTTDECSYAKGPEGVIAMEVGGVAVASGDWIVKYVNGQFDVRSDERFQEEFEPR